jgi:hypothetical protein
MIAKHWIQINAIWKAFLGFLMIVLLTNSKQQLLLVVVLNVFAAYFIAKSISYEANRTTSSFRIFSFKLDRFCFTKMIGDHFHKEKPPKFWWFFLLYLLLL